MEAWRPLEWEAHLRGIKTLPPCPTLLLRALIRHLLPQPPTTPCTQAQTGRATPVSLTGFTDFSFFFFFSKGASHGEG